MFLVDAGSCFLILELLKICVPVPFMSIRLKRKLVSCVEVFGSFPNTWRHSGIVGVDVFGNGSFSK